MMCLSRSRSASPERTTEAVHSKENSRENTPERNEPDNKVSNDEHEEVEKGSFPYFCLKK